MKKLGLFLSTYFLVVLLFGQSQIPEGGYENWTPSTLGTYEEPSGGWWTTLNSLKNIGGPVTVEKTSDAYSGNYAARLETKQWGTFVLPGILVSGVFMTASPFVIQGQAFTEKPMRFMGYYKYTSVNNDSAAIFAMITKYNSLSGHRDTLAQARFAVLSTVSTYTAFDIPFHYSDSITTPDSIDVVFSSSAGAQNFAGQLGSTLFVDDVLLEYPNGLEENIFSGDDIQIFPNPSGEILNIDIQRNMSDLEGRIFSLTGKLVSCFPIVKNTHSLNVHQLETGKYLLNIYSNKSLLASKKIIVSH